MLKWPFSRPKKKVHRDEAGAIFLDHSFVESDKLRNALLPELRVYCDLNGNSDALEAIVSLPRITLVVDEPTSKARPTLDAHCLALATARGIESIWKNVDPISQGRVMVGIVSKLIIEDDVGAENLGHVPNPRLTTGTHVSYAPGTFVGGTPSKQKQLTDRYRELDSAPEQLVSLLAGLHLIRPSAGLLKWTYAEEYSENGLVGKNRAATVLPSPEEIDSLGHDLFISDPDAALSELAPKTIQRMLPMIDNVDPFWPTFCKDHTLTWLP